MNIRWLSKLWLCVTAVLLIATSACSPLQDLRAAVGATASEDEVIRLSSAVNRKLGSVKGTALQGMHANYSTAGRVVALTYETAFARETATEELVMKATDWHGFDPR
jgi:hypothetical protein